MTATLEQTKTDWQRLLRLIPGYDPFATAGDCTFDEDAAQEVLDFFPDCLKHVEGALAGQPFFLEDWEKAIVANLFGWKRPDGTRRYRTAFIFIPRKNGKTPLVAGINCYVLFCDPEIGQQNYLAAAETDQATLVFRHATGMIEAEPMMDSKCTIYGKHATNQVRRVVVPETSSFMVVLSGDAKSKDGQNPHLVTVDELHAQPSRKLVDVLRTGMASANRRQSMFIYITTSDYERVSICNEEYDYACKVRDDDPGFEDPTYLPVIYEADKKDDWTAESTWEKANPNIDISVSREYLRSECRKAQLIPARENEFKRLHLNLRTEQVTRWLPMDAWDKCNAPFTAESLKGRECFGGLDLSSKIDITSLALVFPPLDEADIWRVLFWFWVPGDTMEARYRQDKVPYPVWYKQGFIEKTQGNVVDYSFIRKRVNELNKIYSIQDVGFDPYNATHLAQELADHDGIPMVEFRQGFISMNEPSKELERLTISQQISHNGNPVIRWMASNVAARIDPAGNIKPDKEKSKDKIDGVVSEIMGIGRALANKKKTSVYESRGIRTL